MVVRLTEQHSVTSTQSSSSSSSSSNMATDIPSWSKMYGQGDRRCLYSPKYGRSASYEPSSVRIKNKYAQPLQRQSRAEASTVSLSYRARTSSSVDRDVGSESLYSNKAYSRRAYSVDRDVNVAAYGSTSTKVRPWREKLKIAENKRRVSERGQVESSLRLGTALRRAGSTDRGLSRSASYEPSVMTRHRTYDLDSRLEVSSQYDNTMPVRKSRASSVARAGIDYEGIIAQAQKKRAASVSRLDDDYDVHHHSSSAVARALASTGTDIIEHRGNTQATMASFEDHIRRGKDISSFVFRPGESWEPERVKVLELSSGRKARTYTTFNQYGHGGGSEANNKINEVTLRTKILEQSMSTLEDFVRRNRSYFPEETTIYQQIRFYQLNQDQLRDIGEHPDAEVYGVKVREKLVVPPGTDVGHILSRYYKNSDVDVEHVAGSSGSDRVSVEGIQTAIRRQVESEFQQRDAQRGVAHETYECRAATAALAKQDQFNHLSSHLTPSYIQSIYRDAGVGFEDIYQRSGTSTLTSPTASLASDLESGRSSASSRRRTYDQVPYFTAKLRNKQCIAGQTIKFNCSVSGLPFPEVTWFKGNRQLSEGGRIAFTSNYGLLSLEVQRVTKEDAGIYSVRAINTEGEVASSASLDVIEVDVSDRSDRGSQKPHFIMEPANAAAEAGGRAILEARAAGRPAPTFRWFRDNVPVSEGPRVKVYDDAQGNTKLVLSDLRPEDAALYFLTAENHAGRARCAATLRVLEYGQLRDERRRSLSAEPSRGRGGARDVAPTLDLGRRPLRGDKPWFIQQPPVEMTVREGEPLTLRCMVDGDPKPVVTWCKGVRELQYTERHRVLTEGDHYMMQIQTTTQYDRGQYIVVAENAVGRAHANCWVNVLPAGEEGDGDDIEFHQFKLELPAMELEEVSTGKLGKQAPMFVKRLPRERTVSAGSSLELHCVVREATPEVINITEYNTKVTGKLELKEETVRVAADGTVTKKTEVIDLEGKGKPPLPPKAAAAKADGKPELAESEAASAETPEKSEAAKSEEVTVVKSEEVPAEPEAVSVKSEEVVVKSEEVPVKPVEVTVKPDEVTVKSEEVAAKPEEVTLKPEEVLVKSEEVTVKSEEVAVESEEVPVKLDGVAAKTEEVNVPVTIVHEDPEPKAEEVRQESMGITEEVIQPEVVEKPQQAPVEVKAVSPEPETSPVPQTSAPEPTPVEPPTAPPAVVEETIEAVSAEKVHEIIVSTETAAKPETAISGEEPAPAPIETAPETVKTQPEPAAIVVEETKPEPIQVDTVVPAPEIPVEEVAVAAVTPEVTPAEPEPVPTEVPQAMVEDSKPGDIELKETRSDSLDSQSSLPETPTSPKGNEPKSEAEGGLPVFLEKLRNIMVPAGATTTFSCTINTTANATASWTKDGEALTSRTNLTVTADGCTHAVTICGVTKADEGCYTCTSTNRNGPATTSGTLSVESTLTKAGILLNCPVEKPAEEAITPTEHAKPTEQDATEMREADKTSQPRDSASESESDSESDSDSSTISISSDSEESDSELAVLRQKTHKKINSRRLYVETLVPRLSDLPPRASLSARLLPNRRPLLTSSCLWDGRQ